MTDDASREQTTSALDRLVAGDELAAAELLPLVYEQLRALAARFMHGASNLTLQPTAVVHEAYMKMVGAGDDWRSKAHFQAVAAKAMRQVLIDGARKRGAAKRGHGLRRVTLAEAAQSDGTRDVDVLDLDDALGTLEKLRPRHAQLVELRFFGGLGMKEAAMALGVSLSSAEKDWAMARAWLLRTLDTESEGD